MPLLPPQASQLKLTGTNTCNNSTWNFLITAGIKTRRTEQACTVKQLNTTGCADTIAKVSILIPLNLRRNKLFYSSYQATIYRQHIFYCPNKGAALVIIVVSLTYTAYLCGALITLWYQRDDLFEEVIMLIKIYQCIYHCYTLPVLIQAN